MRCSRARARYINRSLTSCGKDILSARTHRQPLMRRQKDPATGLLLFAFRVNDDNRSWATENSLSLFLFSTRARASTWIRQPVWMKRTRAPQPGIAEREIGTTMEVSTNVGERTRESISGTRVSNLPVRVTVQRLPRPTQQKYFVDIYVQNGTRQNFSVESFTYSNINST